MKDRQPLLEQDLSPWLMAYLHRLGYCVHGEVALWDRCDIIDHVAHLGPCEAPTYIVTFELKSRMGEGLLKQLDDNDRGHYQDAHYAVTHHRREDGPHHRLWAKLEQQAAQSESAPFAYWWLKPGWITFNRQGEIEQLIEGGAPSVRCLEMSKSAKEARRYHRLNAWRMLLVEQNRGVPGGVCLKKGEHRITHYSLGCDWIKAHYTHHHAQAWQEWEHAAERFVRDLSLPCPRLLGKVSALIKLHPLTLPLPERKALMELRPAYLAHYTNQTGLPHYLLKGAQQRLVLDLVHAQSREL